MFGSKPPWGWLYPYQENLRSYALKERSYVVGMDKKDDVVICEDHIGGKVTSEQFSRLAHDPHLFKVKRKDNEVLLKAITGCDVFINKTKIINQQEKYILKHNDILAVIRPEAKVFLYLDNEAIETAEFPKEIKEKYVASLKIGEGGFGVVTLMFHKKTGKKYALKKIFKRPKQQKYAETEKKILTTVSHPYVIHMEEEFDTPDSLYIVLEYMEGGDLSARIRRSSGLIESIAKFFFYQIALAVDYLHDLGIAHRDLKPENILLSSDEVYSLVKVTDFGVSKAEWNTKLRTSLGTPSYEAPEVIRAADTGKSYTNKVDVWSLGVILYCCLSGKLPFESWDEILSGLYRFTPQTLAKISKPSVDLVRRMLIVDPVNRLDIKKILAHQWLQDNMMRRMVQSLSQGNKPKGAAATQVVPRQEVAPQLQVPHAKPVPVASPLKPVPAGPRSPKPAIQPGPGCAVPPRQAHVENMAPGSGNKPLPERRFLNERRQGQPRGVLRFLPEAADKGRLGAAVALPHPPPPEPLEAYHRIDNRRTQPFPGIVKKNLYRFEEKKQ